MQITNLYNKEGSLEDARPKSAEDIQIMCSGGNVDWAMQSARSNTRAEQTHILAAMIQLFPVGLDVLYAVDYTGAISNFNESQFWTSTQWINCVNRENGRNCFHETEIQEERHELPMLSQSGTSRKMVSSVTR